MKILLFNMLWEMGPLGLLNVVTFLESKGYPCQHIYLTKKEDETEAEAEAVLRFIEEQKPDLVGFSMMTFNFLRTKRLTIEVKKRMPDVPVIHGGIHATFNPGECIKYADYVCVGEGEEAMLDLVRAMDSGQRTDNIPNIWARQNGQVAENSVRPLIENLDDYPFPRFNWNNSYCLDEEQIKPLTKELYRKYVIRHGVVYDVMASRGCPYACAYCCNALFRRIYKGKGKFVRYRSPENVVAELKYAQSEFPEIKVINLQDDGFAGGPEEYLRNFSKIYRKEIGLALRCRVIPTLLNEKKAQYLKDANMLVVVIGVQSSDRVNREIFNRKVSSDQLLQAARLLKKHDIVIEYDLIIRNPFETEEDMIEKCRILARLPKPYQLFMFGLALFPHSPLRDRAIAEGIAVNENDGYEENYGSYPLRFPYLQKLQQTCPYSPRWLVEFFIRTRHSRFCRGLFHIHYHYICTNIERLKILILKSPTVLAIVKRIIFFPNAVAGLFKRKSPGSPIAAT